MEKRTAKPVGANWIAPYLTVKDIERALHFYAEAFGFEKRFALPGPDGGVMHAEMTWQESTFMMGGESPHHECKAPASTSVRSPVSLYVYCEDVDAIFARATAAGAKGESAPEEMFWGDRMCTLVDPDGHIWHFATNVGEFDPSKVPAGCG